jgi:pantoate--beta-alanine ligase
MVRNCSTLIDLMALRQSDTKTVGFVPTMGNLHEGHISLLERGLQEFETIYFSIFVNPKQFGPAEDFNRYPRTLEQDLKKIEDCLARYSGKRVIVFAPLNPNEVFSSSMTERNISVEGLKDVLEGAVRPGHFDGVATVVYRLFEIIRPGRAYFGLKDYQQYLVIKKMVKDLSLPVEIVGMPIVREPSGLALSSRNQFLSPEEREEGLILSQSLRKLADMASGHPSELSTVKDAAQKLLQDKKWNYLEIRDAETLSTETNNSKKIVILGVYQLRTTMLLDNIEVVLS